jgi:tRNA-dihydrouridine synthase
VVARVKRAVRIPVLGGGGIREAADAARLVAETGADGVAIGRGSLGNPWIFRQTVAAISGSAAPALPTAVERGRALLELVEGEFKCYGPGLARRRLARTSCSFARFLPDFPAFRAAVQPVSDVAGLRRLVAELFR